MGKAGNLIISHHLQSLSNGSVNPYHSRSLMKADCDHHFHTQTLAASSKGKDLSGSLVLVGTVLWGAKMGSGLG